MSRQTSPPSARCGLFNRIQYKRVREWSTSSGPIRGNVKRKQLPVGSMPIFFRHSAQPSERVVFLRRSYKWECQEKTAPRRLDAGLFLAFSSTEQKSELPQPSRLV